MNTWHLIPWSLQYLVSGIFILIISAVIFSRNRGSLAYQNFFAYGFCIATWEIMAFLHRNAPTSELSKLFFRIDLFFVSISLVFLPLTILCIWRESKSYFWLALPAFIIGIYAFLIAPYDIFWSNFGWSYKFTDGFKLVFHGMTILYLFLFCGAFINLTRRISARTLSRKYKFVFFGCLFFYAIGMTITTLFIQRYPNFPPLGGILTLVQFLFIAYAVYLKPEKITPYSELRVPISELSQSYITFLNSFQATIPGSELGESSFRFQDYIDAMGLESILVYKSGTLIFEADKLTEENISGAPDSILRMMKEHNWAAKAANNLEPILLRTYELIKSQSDSGANEWFAQLIQEHGGFSNKYDLFGSLPQEIQIPPIFTQLKPGRAYLFKEDTPLEAYRMLKETEAYSIERLCVTKLAPQTIRERYGVQKASILWVTSEKVEATTTPKDIVGLTKTISEFSMKPDGTIVLLDCFDQIKFANGFERSLDILKNLRVLSSENKSILLISIPPAMFEKKELNAIEKELEGSTVQ